MGLTKKEIKELPDGTIWLSQTTYEGINSWGRKDTSFLGRIWGLISRIVGKCIWHVTKSAFTHSGVIHNNKQWHWLGGEGLTNNFHPISTAFVLKEKLTEEQITKGTEFLNKTDKSYNYGRLVMLFVIMWKGVKQFFNKLKWFFFSLSFFGENCSAGVGKYAKAIGIDLIENLIEELETPKDYFDALGKDNRFILLGENWDNYILWKEEKNDNKN